MVSVMEEELVGVFVEIDKAIDGFAEVIIGRWTKSDGFADNAHGFEVVYEGDEVAIAGNENNDIYARRNGHGINGHANIPVGFFLAAGKFLDVFDFELDAVGGECFKEGCFFACFGFGDVGDGAHEFTVANGGLNKGGEVHARAV